jgi:hypothetical protein
MSYASSLSSSQTHLATLNQSNLTQIIYPHLGWGLTSELLPYLERKLASLNSRFVLWIQSQQQPFWHAPFLKKFSNCQQKILFCQTQSDDDTFLVLLEALKSDSFDYIFYPKVQSKWDSTHGRRLYYFARKYQTGLIEIASHQRYLTPTPLAHCIIQIEANQWNFLKIKNQPSSNKSWRNPYELFLSQFSKRDPFLPLRLFLQHNPTAILP